MSTQLSLGAGFPGLRDEDVLPPGAKAGPWVVERELGRGGMGAVYAVVHEEIGKKAALKVVHRRLLSAANAERVLIEAKLVNQVAHPNIVDVFDTGLLADERPFIVMERLEGESLAERALRSKILPTDAIVILRQVADALIAAHAAGVVHRDLKLDNVFLVAGEDDVLRAKLLDWGIAKDINHDVRHTTEGQLVGTPQYVSPEQARGHAVTPQSDVYSLGIVAYELFLEHPPFEAETAAEVLVLHLRATPPAPRELWPDIPDALEQLILLMLAKNPVNRPTMLEVAAQLDVVREELEKRAGFEVATPRPRARTSAGRPIARPVSEPAANAGLAKTELPMTQPGFAMTRRRWQVAAGGLVLAAAAVLFVVVRGGTTAAAAPAPAPIVEAAPVAVATPVAPVVAAPELPVTPVVAPVKAAPKHVRAAKPLPMKSTRPVAAPRHGVKVDPDGTIPAYE
jgi:serine/threonine-protein kinase